MKKLSIILPDDAKILLNGVEIGLDATGVGTANPPPLVTSLQTVYPSAEALVLAATGQPNEIWCDSTKINPGSAPIVHFGSKPDGTVRLLVPGENPAARSDDSWNHLPGISTPEMPFGPPYALPGESEISKMMRDNAMGQHASGGDDDLDETYPTLEALKLAFFEKRFKYIINVAYPTGITQRLQAQWEQFGPPTTYFLQADGSVTRRPQ